jgi:EF-P beta-lysylation protein EpmB
MPDRVNTDDSNAALAGDESLRLASRFSPTAGDWHRSLAAAVRDADTLVDLLGLPDSFRRPARRAAELFPLMVPRSYLARMEHGNPRDPLLLQVLPLDAELEDVPGFVDDPLDEDGARQAPGLLQKYAGRALIIVTGACAVHCRYCFRRHYPYEREPRRLDDWEPALQAISGDPSLREVLLSGGDPLMLTDQRLGVFVDRLSAIPHLTRIRFHTRLPIVLPDRVTGDFLDLLHSTRLTPIVVVHANHPHEIAGDCAEGLRQLVRSGTTVLNQAVLLRGINDNTDAQTELCERLVNLGVLPYYLHQLDRVAGTAHFAVSEQRGREIVQELQQRLPGYAVPRYVREIPGASHKVSLT